jgi:hypothetical protein
MIVVFRNRRIKLYKKKRKKEFIQERCKANRERDIELELQLLCCAITAREETEMRKIEIK